MWIAEESNADFRIAFHFLYHHCGRGLLGGYIVDEYACSGGARCSSIVHCLHRRYETNRMGSGSSNLYPKSCPVIRCSPPIAINRTSSSSEQRHSTICGICSLRLYLTASSIAYTRAPGAGLENPPSVALGAHPGNGKKFKAQIKASAVERVEAWTLTWLRMI